MNLGVRNYGPLPAQRVRVAGQIHWFAPLTKSAEDDAWSEFRRTAPLGKPQDVDVTGEQYDAFQSQTLTDSDLRDIGDHKLVLYVLMYYEYQDSGGSHYTESCHALQDVPKGISIPGGLRVTSGEIVWHICNDHNTIR
jgi:hypothetical protein